MSTRVLKIRVSRVNIKYEVQEVKCYDEMSARKTIIPNAKKLILASKYCSNKFCCIYNNYCNNINKRERVNGIDF